eukprot:5258071-Pleurochrysis_carterae.AAC.1
MTRRRDCLHYICSRMIRNATEACTTVPPPAKCFAGTAYVYTVTPAKDDYGRRSSIKSVKNTCSQPFTCTSVEEA